MALNNFTNLAVSVNSWLDRSDLSETLIQDLCTLVERKLSTKLRVKEMNTRYKDQFTAIFNTMPTDYLFGLRIRPIGQEQAPLEYRTPQALDDKDGRGGNDKARFFTINGTEIQLDQSIPYETTETVSSLTGSGTTATMTTAAVHNLVAGDYIRVSGATETEYNGTFEVVSAPTTTTLTYTMATAATSSPATGTITYLHLNIELTYYAKPSGLTTTNLTNDILTNYPDVYLFGCLAEASKYTQDPESLQYYEQRFVEAVDFANEQSFDAEVSGSDMAVTPIIGFYNKQ